MPGEILTFDAAGSNIDGTDPGTALLVGPGTLYGLREFSAPAPPQTVQWATSVDVEGSLPASRKHENRVVTMTIMCATAVSVRTLQLKIGKIAREGGTLKWVMPNAEIGYFDLHSADTFDPLIDLVHYARAGAYCDVRLTLLARPYIRCAEVTLSSHASSSGVLVFTETGIKGDVPALGRLVVTEGSAQDQRFLVWGVQSRYYDSASGAALFFQAESCGMMAAVVATGPAGATSGGTNNTAFHNNLPTPPSAVNLVSIGPSTTAQPHIGSFRVFARFQVPSTNTGVVSVAVTWQPAIGPKFILNDSVSLTGTKDNWYIADLGEVSASRAIAGSQGWFGAVQASSTVAGDDIYMDWVMLVPILEGSGSYIDPNSVLPRVFASGTAQIRSDSALASWTGGYMPPLSPYEGDYLLVPPAGAEARTVRFIAKMSRGAAATDDKATAMKDPAADSFTGQLFYTPRYLVVPTP